MSKESNYPEITAAITALRELLERYRIPVEAWGVGKAKTIEHLAKEIAHGETTLVENGTELLRQIEVLRVIVYYNDGDKTFRLKEAKQIQRGGDERIRGYTWVSEKLKHGEDKPSAITRALLEEINATHDLVSLDERGIETDIRGSDSFPGLNTQYKIYKYEVYLATEDYIPEGYIEIQDQMATHFEWELVDLHQ